MQITNEERHAKAKKEVVYNNNFIFFGQDGRLYEYDGVAPPVCLSIACDPATWDLPHVYPKKRKKRKKDIYREITRVKNTEHTN